LDTTLHILKAIGGYLVYISPPIFGSICGVIVGGYIIQRYWIRKANESVLIDYLTKELGDLVDETLEYWSLDCSGTGAGPDEARKQARKLEPKIKAAIKNLGSVLRYYSDRYCCDIDFSQSMVEISDACTGGQFEVVKRSADSHRFLSVVNATTRIRSMLIGRRI